MVRKWGTLSDRVHALQRALYKSAQAIQTVFCNQIMNETFLQMLRHHGVTSELQWVDTQLVLAGSWFPQTLG